MTTAARQPGIFNRKSSGLVTWPSLPGGATAVVDPHRTIPARQSKRTSCCAYTEAFLVIEQQLLSLRGVAHPHFPTKEMMNVRGREMKLSIYLRCAAGVLTSIAPIGLANAEPLAQGPSIPAERGLQLLGDEPSYLDLGVGVFSCHPPRRHRYPTAAIRKFTDSPLEGDGFELPVRGRGQSGCRPFWVGCALRSGAVRARRFWYSAVSATGLGYPLFSAAFERH